MRVGEHFANEENDCDGITCADPVQDFEVEEEICHDFDDQTLENDICLLRLKGSLKMNSKCVNMKSFLLLYLFQTFNSWTSKKILLRISL